MANQLHHMSTRYESCNSVSIVGDDWLVPKRPGGDGPNRSFPRPNVGLSRLLPAIASAHALNFNNG
jgi:hypothetical protein